MSRADAAWFGLAQSESECVSAEECAAQTREEVRVGERDGAAVGSSRQVWHVHARKLELRGAPVGFACTPDSLYTALARHT